MKKEPEQDRTLMTWQQVTDEWNRRSGETITRARVHQVAVIAMAKIKKRLLARYGGATTPSGIAGSED